MVLQSYGDIRRTKTYEEISYDLLNQDSQVIKRIKFITEANLLAKMIRNANEDKEYRKIASYMYHDRTFAQAKFYLKFDAFLPVTLNYLS